MVRLGFRDMGIQNERQNKLILDIRNGASLTFKGNCVIGGGTKIYIKGKLVIGNDFYLSLNSTIIAHEYIEFKDNCTVGWDCLIMDTDFHQTFNTQTKEIYPMKRT